MGHAAVDHGGAHPPLRLVYHAGALGDFITSLPAMDAWRGQDPTILLGKPAFAVLADPPFADVWDAGDARWSSLFGESPRDAGLPAAISHALVFASSSSPLPGGLRAQGVKDVTRLDPFPERPQPIVDFHLAQVGALRAPGQAVPRIRLAPEEEEPSGSPRRVALAPGSGSPSKNWPGERFIALAGRLRERRCPVTWVLGPAESAWPDSRDDGAWRDLGLAVLAARLSRCALFVGNDAGVTHLAAATDCPTLALFGASDALTWAPRGTAARVIASPTGAMNDITLAVVFDACCDWMMVGGKRRTDVRR